MIESPFLRRSKKSRREDSPRIYKYSTKQYGAILVLIVILISSPNIFSKINSNQNEVINLGNIDLNSLFPQSDQQLILDANASALPSDTATSSNINADNAAVVSKWNDDLIRELRDGVASKENMKLLPSLVNARNQYELMCFNVINNPCELASGSNPIRTVVLLGDSRMMMLLPPIVSYFKNAQIWKVLNWSIQACSTVRYVKEEAPNEACAARQKYVSDNLNRIKPDLVIVSEKYHPDLQYYVQLHGFLEQIVSGKYIQVVPYGYLKTSPEQCFERNGSYKIRCFSMSAATPGSIYQIKSMFNGWSTPFLDLNKLVCQGAICPPIHAGTLVFRDISHISVKFSEDLTDVVGYQLASLIPRMSQ
jgi:hypothetical protein